MMKQRALEPLDDTAVAGAHFYKGGDTNENRICLQNLTK